MDRAIMIATDFLTQTTGKEPETITAKGNGFSFTIENLNRSALDVFGVNRDYETDTLYCLLETENQDGIGRYQETLRYNMPGEEGVGFHAEIYYSRTLFGDDPHEQMKAQIEGMLWLTTPKTHEALGQECDDSYYLRTAEHASYEMHGIANTISTLSYHAGLSTPEARAKGRKIIHGAIESINRALIRSQ